MSTEALKIFLDYGPLGAFIIIFSLVIRHQHILHQKTIERIEKEKNEQIAELKIELKELKVRLSDVIGESHVTIGHNTNSLERNSEMLKEVGYLLKDILKHRLES